MAEHLITIVSDNEDLAELMAGILGREGYETGLFTSDDLVRENVRAAESSLVVLDLHFDRPGEGLAVLESLRFDPTTAGVPVIVCTASADFINKKRSLLESMRCMVLEKPFHAAELLHSVRTALGEF